MKKITLIALLASISFSVNAQNVFKFGIAGGLNISKMNAETSSKSLTGFHGGLITEIKLPIELGVEADVLISTKGGVYEGYDSNFQPKDVDFKLMYVDVPVLAKLYILKVINIQAGPQFSYLLSAKYDGIDVKDNFNSMDIAVVAGLGLDVSKLHGAVRYNYGVTNIGPGDRKNSVIQVSVGYWIK